MEETLGISATEDSVNSALKRDYRYRVPDYQRRYSWKKKQWRELWNDLQTLEDEKTHFLGAIVVVERPGDLNKIGILEVVDGQQRLATVSLLLVSMTDRYRKEGEIGQARAINASVPSQSSGRSRTLVGRAARTVQDARESPVSDRFAHS